MGGQLVLVETGNQQLDQQWMPSHGQYTSAAQDQARPGQYSSPQRKQKSLQGGGTGTPGKGSKSGTSGKGAVAAAAAAAESYPKYTRQPLCVQQVQVGHDVYSFEVCSSQPRDHASTSSDETALVPPRPDSGEASPTPLWSLGLPG